MTPRSTYQRLLGYAGWLVVILILGFLILPAAVVTIAAFNDKAILSFPPQAWSLRWFAKAIAYRDFREGLRNGLIVTSGYIHGPGKGAPVTLVIDGGTGAFAGERGYGTLQPTAAGSHVTLHLSG